jgi:hypothetical protein
LTVGVLLCGVVQAQSTSTRKGSFDAWLELGGGNETGARFNPESGLPDIPEGSFLGLTPAGRFFKPLGPRSTLQIVASGSLERFFENDGRSLSGLSTWLELTGGTRRGFYGRAAAGVNYFDDSAMETADRGEASLRVAGGFGGARRGVELTAGVYGRRYPNVVSTDESGSPGTYVENVVGLGLAGWANLGSRWLLTGELERQQTDARDPLFDSDSWLLRAGIRVLAARRWTGWLSGIFQQREFDKRESDFDEDDYVQLGLRVDRAVGRRQSVGLTYSYVDYEDPEGSSDSSHRVAAVYLIRFGRPVDRDALRRVASAVQVKADPLVSDGIVRFRLYAPEAAEAGVAGDFNAWTSARAPLRSVGGGWWETTIEMPPGSYQFVYVVDGEWTTPPAAGSTVDDGFGGRNGFFQVPD